MAEQISPRYEIGGDASLHLVRSGIDLFASTPVNPTICIANYAFSDLPQDLYAVVDSVLYQELVELSALETGPESTPANFFGSLFVATERVPVSPTEMGGVCLAAHFLPKQLLPVISTIDSSSRPPYFGRLKSFCISPASASFY